MLNLERLRGSMTVAELIEHLERIADEHGGETLVVGAYQPNYPMVSAVVHVCLDRSNPEQKALVIALNDYNDYGSRAHWSEEEIEPDADEDQD